jgi:abortive infection bacteriophage resistance protein
MFDKTAISIGEQIIKLQGLIVTENDNAHYLSHISYYRLENIGILCKMMHLFKQNSKFKDVISLIILMQS